MKQRMSARWVIGLLLFAAIPSFGQLVTPASTPGRSEVKQMISWLPADTEVVFVTERSFVMPPYPDWNNPQRERSGVFNSPLSLALGNIGLKKGLLVKQLEGLHVIRAVEGSRHFRPPSGLGMMLYEGCAIVVFGQNLSDAQNAFRLALQQSPPTVELIEGEKVMVIREKLENDIWTLYVAFPEANILMVATDPDYLREVLSRKREGKGPSALPDSLPEWKYLDPKAQCWALRHFSRSEQAKRDPTSPLARSNYIGPWPDEQAIGLVLSFDVDGSGTTRAATVIFLSSDKGLLKDLDGERCPFCSKDSPAKTWRPEYRELDPGAVKGSFDLTGHKESPRLFVFFTVALLGHAIYL